MKVTYVVCFCLCTNAVAVGCHGITHSVALPDPSSQYTHPVTSSDITSKASCPAALMILCYPGRHEPLWQDNLAKPFTTSMCCVQIVWQCEPKQDLQLYLSPLGGQGSDAVMTHNAQAGKYRTHKVKLS